MTNHNVSNKTIVIAGATGDLGGRIASHVRRLGVNVKALVRQDSNADAIRSLEEKGVHLAKVDFDNAKQLAHALTGSSCIVSALNGVEEVILGVQTKLLQAAVDAGTPRFIPSDYCIDYTKLPYGTNRNLDLRRRFNELLDKAHIASTSVLNGMFADLLTGQAPVILFGLKRVVYWGSPKQLMDFTTIDNTAEFTAHAAIDNSTPRYLRIAGDVTDAEGLREAASTALNKEFKLLRAGSLERLKTMIKITRFLFPKKKEVFPPWQGMQYLHNMSTGLPKLTPLDNERYPGIHWTSVEELLSKNSGK